MDGNADGCFHCGEPLPPLPVIASLGARRVATCCAGCAAAAELIDDLGLAAYYAHRDGFAPRPGPGDPARWLAFDRPALAAELVAPLADGGRALTLALGGVRCAACAWLVERALAGVAGVRSARLNAVTGRLALELDAATPALSQVLARIEALGYTPHPGATAAVAAEDERRSLLKRLAVAGLASMQSMGYGVALWFAPQTQMDIATRRFLEWVSLLLAIPVVSYAALPFLRNACAQVAALRPGMDVPIAAALLLAVGTSAYNTLHGLWPVYYDSASMFVFLLLAARLLELSARQRAGDTATTLSALLPATATRIDGGVACRVGRNELRTGDVVRVLPGEPVPADATLLSAGAELDESLLTGESRPVPRTTGAALAGGSVNAGSVFDARVERVGGAALVAQIGRLVAAAQAERPPLALAADRIALAFVAGVLVLAAGAALWWWQVDAARAVPIALAVLIATCPCALGLATPAAFTCATGALARAGVFVTRARALGALATVTDVAFDKTGTLTRGEPVLVSVEPLRAGVDATAALDLAAALEQASEHALAGAFPRTSTAAGDLAVATAVENVAGRGIEGCVAGRRLRIGEAAWVAALAAGGALPAPDAAGPHTRAGVLDARRAPPPAALPVPARQPREPDTHDPVRRGGRDAPAGDAAAGGPEESDTGPEESDTHDPTHLAEGVTDTGQEVTDTQDPTSQREMDTRDPVQREAGTRVPAHLAGRDAPGGAAAPAAAAPAAAAPAAAAQAAEADTHDPTQRPREPDTHLPNRLAQDGAASADAADSVVVLGDARGAIARFALRDGLRVDAAACVRALRDLGLVVHVLSGDAPGPVAGVATALGIEAAQARSRLLPAGKLAALQALQARGRRVLMVGDGVNDAPVLAAADVAIAIGAGTALAQAQADAILSGQHLLPVVAAIRHARRTRRIVHQNLAWALAYNITALPVAVAGLLEPWAAALGMSASSLLVVANALRLRDTGIAGPRSDPTAGAAAAREVAAA